MLKRLPKRNPEIGLTAFVDILFNILAFILVVGSLEQAAPSRMDVSLPRVPEQSTAIAMEERKLEIVMDRLGKIRVNDQEVTKEQLIQIIQLRGNETETVIIWADRNLAYEKVVSLLASVQAGGGAKVRLAVLPGLSVD
jgi:biopolymer transport protein ExbD